MQLLKQNTQRMILIGVWANRNWILGNWIREIKSRHNKEFRIWWIPSIYAGKRKLEKLLVLPIPKANAYFFSYPTIFGFYFNKSPHRFNNNSLVLYPHNEPEMGDVKEQVKLLNNAYKVYFFCKHDCASLISNGLKSEKVLVANCAIDNDCVIDSNVTRDEKSIILASKFGPRKGADLLPGLIKSLPDWNFILMGRDWDQFLRQTNLQKSSNFVYVKFNKQNRSKFFSKAKIFLSLSNLEGGPVPLLESMSLGVVPICTNTGFAPEFIQDGVNGYLLPINPNLDFIISRINSVDKLTERPEKSVSHLTWDRIAKFTLVDLNNISNKNF